MKPEKAFSVFEPDGIETHYNFAVVEFGYSRSGNIGYWVSFCENWETVVDLLSDIRPIMWDIFDPTIVVLKDSLIPGL